MSVCVCFRRVLLQSRNLISEFKGKNERKQERYLAIRAGTHSIESAIAIPITVALSFEGRGCWLPRRHAPGAAPGWGV